MFKTINKLSNQPKIGKKLTPGIPHPPPHKRGLQILVNHSKHSQYYPKKPCQNDHHIQKSMMTSLIDFIVLDKKRKFIVVWQVYVCARSLRPGSFVISGTEMFWQLYQFSLMSWISSFLKTLSHCYHNKCAWLVHKISFAVNDLWLILCGQSVLIT